MFFPIFNSFPQCLKLGFFLFGKTWGISTIFFVYEKAVHRKDKPLCIIMDMKL